tara:strand:- start:411 stop:881 length:471 start_codon:yes stop_codon:yes gene_type:complete
MSEETKTGSNRTPRSASSRSSKAARKPWTPPQILETPPAPAGMRYRWIRTHIRGEDDKTNVHMRLREGFEPVKPSEVEGYDLPTIDDGKHAGTVGVGGLILCKIPEETADERNAHFEQQTENQMRAVDNDLMREENPAMPMTRERKTQVSFGKGRT